VLGMKQGEIVIYKSNENSDFQIEVLVEDETVWLTQGQMVELFDSTKQNISLHINNIFKEGELQASSTVKEYLTVQKEGERRVKRKIDNYIDESVLVLLTKRQPKVEATIYTSNISKQLKLDIERFNAQYSKINLTQFHKSHDRFLIIDNQTVYHIGASLKDLGKKWFAFSKIQLDASEMINKLTATTR